MVKHEIKVEVIDIDNIIENAYFNDGFKGKLLERKHFIPIQEEDEINWIIFKGLNNATVRITNENIDGFLRCMVDETNNDIRLYPISMYCVKDEKYSFY